MARTRSTVAWTAAIGTSPRLDGFKDRRWGSNAHARPGARALRPDSPYIVPIGIDCNRLVGVGVARAGVGRVAARGRSPRVAEPDRRLPRRIGLEFAAQATDDDADLVARLGRVLAIVTGAVVSGGLE